VAALVIMLILALLLRYLMASVGVGGASALGATALVLQHLEGDERVGRP
jgi:hypothetical protein